MEKTAKKEKLTLIVLVSVALFAIAFVSVMGYFNYRATAIELEDTVIAKMEEDSAGEIGYALSFGKSFVDYYGMGDLFKEFNREYPGPRPFVVSVFGKLMYYGNWEGEEERIQKLLDSDEFKAAFESLDANDRLIRLGKTHISLVPIVSEDTRVGYFCSVYDESIFGNNFKRIGKVIAIEAGITAIFVCIALWIFAQFSSKRERKRDPNIEKIIDRVIPIAVIGTAILILSLVSLYSYQKDYRDKMNNSVKMSINGMEIRIDRVVLQGVELRDVDGLEDYIRDHIESLNMLKAVRISERISEVIRNDEESNVITFALGDNMIRGDEAGALYLEAEISDAAVSRAMRKIILVLLSTTIILLIFVYELVNLIDLSKAEITENEENELKEDVFSEKRVATSLRFSGLLCSTAEYMCLPYAAMMIRANGESLFGLSVGMTAALPLTFEALAQLIGMFVMPKFVRKFDIMKVLIASSILMIACNLSAFAVGTAAVIVICRGIAGFAYAGFKQVSNYLITSGYETEAGRSDNISQDNAGLLAGATCGAGLGAIISANAGFSMTFLASAVLVLGYLVATFRLTPWKMISKRLGDRASMFKTEREPVKIKEVLKLFISPEMGKYLLLVAIPLNIGVMLCVTLIPAICQTKGISSVLLSYCYILNGIAGIYIGPSLVSRAKTKFGTLPCLAFTFMLTAVGIFILRLPAVIIMILLSSAILGFLDGFGTPISTDRFMELDIVRESVDESTALLFSVISSYMLLIFAPTVAELMLRPNIGKVSPMMIGAGAYVLVAVLLLFSKRSKEE